MQNQVNDKRYVIDMSDDEDLEEIFLDDEDDEDLEETLREFRVPARLH
jgi:hypothetical protein